jgi:hypothetical protein
MHEAHPASAAAWTAAAMDDAGFARRGAPAETKAALTAALANNSRDGGAFESTCLAVDAHLR